jgi:nucleotide-binding universal stress UspA family protein
MVNRHPVLVAIDHATDVKRILAVALSTATARGADVHVIQVVPHGAAHVDDGTGVRRVTLRGRPEHVIPAYAELHEATVLVVERHYGSSRFWRNGRVVNDLARRSPIPLLVLPARPMADRAPESAPRRILAPVDFSTASAVALRTALDLSRRHGARVTLLHAIKDVPRHMVFSGSEAWQVVRRLPAHVGAVSGRLRRKAAFFGADDVGTEVATGAADSAILEIARRSDTDLIVMGVAHRPWLHRVLVGSTLRRVLRRATVPVLVVPVVAGAHTWPNGLGVHLAVSRSQVPV